MIAVLPSTSGLELTAYPKTTLLDVSLVRNGVTIAHGTVLTDDVGDGAVNGGGTAADCWTDVTPDISPGDEVHVIGTGFDDSTIVQGTSADMPVQTTPGTVVVHGTAADAQGNQLPVTGVEARITSKTLFSNGKRVLRAGTGQPGLLSYDTPNGTSWTATFSGLSSGDVALATNPLESRGVFTNAALNESTISQNPAAPGPSAPCSAPALRDAATSSTPSSVNIAHAGQDLVVSGVAQDATAVSITLGDGATTLTESGTLTGAGTSQTWSATFPAGDVAGLSQGTLTATPTFTTAAGSIGGAPLRILKDLSAPGAPVASPPPGAGPFHGTQAVSLSVGDATAQIHWTNDGTTPDASSPVLARGAQITVSASQTIRAIAIDPAGNPGAVSTLDYTILPAASGAGGAVATGPSSTTIIQQIPLFLPAIGPRASVQGTTATSPVRPAVRGLSVAMLRGHALRVTMRLDGGARVVRLRVFRARGGVPSGSALVTAVKSPLGGGRLTATLSGRALRGLKAGAYVLEARAGASRTALGAASRRAFRVS